MVEINKVLNNFFNEINEKIKSNINGILYLEILKSAFIDKLKNIDKETFIKIKSDLINNKEYKNTFDFNNVIYNYEINFFNEEVIIEKSNINNDYLYIIIEGFLNFKVFDQKSLNKFLNINIDTLILGCTHYPLIEDLIKKIIPSNITIINSAGITARYIKDFFIKNHLNSNNVTPKYSFYINDHAPRFIKLAKIFLNKNSINIKCIQIK